MHAWPWADGGSRKKDAGDWNCKRKEEGEENVNPIYRQQKEALDFCAIGKEILELSRTGTVP